MMSVHWGIRYSITFNNKRMEKLAALKGNVQKLREQILKYVVAENQLQHAHLNELEMRRLVAELVEEV